MRPGIIVTTQIQPSVEVLSAYFNGAAAMLGKAAMKICQSDHGALQESSQLQQFCLVIETLTPSRKGSQHSCC
jgi:hypothetical protein